MNYIIKDKSDYLSNKLKRMILKMNMFRGLFSASIKI